MNRDDKKVFNMNSRFWVYQNNQYIKAYAYYGNARNSAFYMHSNNPSCDFVIYDSIARKVVWEYDSKLNIILRYA